MSKEGLSRLSKKCRACPFVAKCNHKEMEALAYLLDTQIAMSAASPSMVDASQPLLRETTTIIRDGKHITVYRDEIEKALYSSLYSHLGLRYGG